MSYRLTILFFACIAARVGGPEMARAQFVQDFFGQSQTQNRLRSEGEATSVGDPGDPRQEASRTDRFGREFRQDNDPLRDKLLDPRVGPAFDPLKANEGRIFKGTGGLALDTISSITPQARPAGPARYPRRLGAASRAQFVNRLDRSLRTTPRTSQLDREHVIDAVRRSLHSLTDGGVSASVEDGVIVLRGVAESEYRRRMIERFVLLEPGVRQVRNEILSRQPPELGEP